MSDTVSDARKHAHQPVSERDKKIAAWVDQLIIRGRSIEAERGELQQQIAGSAQQHGGAASQAGPQTGQPPRPLQLRGDQQSVS